MRHILVNLLQFFGEKSVFCFRIKLNRMTEICYNEQNVALNEVLVCIVFSYNQCQYAKLMKVVLCVLYIVLVTFVFCGRTSKFMKLIKKSTDCH